MPLALASKRFRILRRLGEGGMGVVYEAEDRERGGKVALKTLRQTSPEHLARLKREFRVMQEVHHANLVALRELLSEDGNWMMTMDLVEGEDWISHVRRRGAGIAAPPRTSSVRPDATTMSDLGDAPVAAAPASGDVPVAAARAIGDAPVFAAARLRPALRQLVDGLEALHAAGMVHRDIKPSNVLVTREGRVVLLDFGLVADESDSATANPVVGTPAYMAPEQAAAGNIGPEADWYAVGVMLHEALTGRLPFDGSGLRVMLRKQTEVPVPASAIGVGVPPDLDALATALLSFDPAARPTAAQLRRRLGGSGPVASAGAPVRRPEAASFSATRTLSPPFVGRARELETLAGALRESRDEGVAVLLEGESGVGKSRLVRQFLERVALEDPETIVVAGRCYERESVPYKAFDGVVDAVAKILARMTDPEAGALLPTHLAPLVQVFPVLRRVRVVAEQTRRPMGALDPFELRTRAFAGLRELLVRVGQRRPLVVVIDDAQWADHDSIALLTEVARVPEAPRMLLLLVVRSGGSEAALAANARVILGVAAAIGMPRRQLALGTLTLDESRELATRLAGHLSGRELTDAELETIAVEACGHPLFVDLLTRAAEGGGVRAKPDDLAAQSWLAQALAEEIVALEPGVRGLLEIVAVAGVPLPQKVAERASDLEPGPFARALQHLRVARFLVTSGVRDEHRVEPYHERVRLAAVAELPDERRLSLHRRIAVALEIEPNADPEALAHHWREAGDAGQAARYCALAGDRATRALAFDRAASFYEQALALDPPTRAARRALLVRLGDAFANAGLGKRAADVFREAALEAPSAEALELQRRAAEELLRSGHFDEGLGAIRTVLAAVGMSLPRSSLWALASVVVLRVLVRLRGLGFTPRDASEISPVDLMRIDVCWSVAIGLSLTDTIYGALFHLRFLLLSLRAGERQRIARAANMQACHLATEGLARWPRAEAVRTAAQRAAEGLPGAESRAWAAVCHGTTQFLVGEFRGARDACDAAITVMRNECAGMYWESNVAVQFSGQSLFYLGELRELARRTSSRLREALDRGDLYAAVNLRLGDPSTVWLVADDPATCTANADSAMREWSKTGFHLEHYYELYTRTNVDLYEGKPRDAYARIHARWGPLRRSLLMRVQFVRCTVWGCRARSAIALARAESGPARSALLAAAERDLRRIARERVPWSMALAKLWGAGAASVRGDDAARVARLLRDAITQCDATGAHVYAQLAKRRLGVVLGGEEGAALAREASAWMESEGVKRPERFAAVFSPGFDGS